MCREKSSALSGLEREFELETESPEERSGSRYEVETDDFEVDDTELEFEFEEGDEELGDSGPGSEYVERFLELSQQEFESDGEMDRAVGEVLGEMEREYFFGRLKKLARKGVSMGTKALLSKARGLAAGLPVAQGLKGLTQLSRGNLMGSLRSLAKTGLTAALRAHPAGAAALTTLRSLGFKDAEVPEDNRGAWEQFVGVSREAYEHLADHLNAETATPAGAAAQAADALQAGLRRRRAPGRTPGAGRTGKVIRLRPGQRITIVVA